jgi:glycosyltransferase involved in cell wall biosynthesis
VSREIYDQVQYQPDDNGYGMEDWHFACQAMGLGFKFFNVADTIFFYRRKRVGSLLAAHVGSASLIRSTKLFEPALYASVASNRTAEVDDNTSTNQPRSSFKYQTVQFIKQHELVHHYVKVQYALHRNIGGALKRRYEASKIGQQSDVVVDARLPKRLSDIGFSKELVHFWGKLNQFEPMIRASADMLRLIPIVGYPETSRLSDVYYELCRNNKDRRFTDLVLVPHVVRGGADLAAVRLINELSKKGDVLVITTLDVASPWLRKLAENENVVCVESKELFVGLDESKRELLMMRIIQNWGIQRLSIVNSELGYKLASKYNKVLRDIGCKTYLHTYAFDMTEDGHIYNAIPNGLVDAYSGIHQYITDSVTYKHQLEAIHGFASDRVSTLYLPIDSTVQSKSKYVRTNKILWASRVSSAKLAEVAVEVGKQLAKHGIELHIYGDLDTEYAADGAFESLIEHCPNIVYHGGYEGFASLPTNDYDMFLLTTKNEGLPGVVLEAMLANIFVIAPAVGGIPECIKEADNGAFVANKFDANSYVETIVATYKNKRYLDSKTITTANKKVLKRHSLSSYSKTLKSLLS